MGGFAWVTLATNDSYSLGALILAHSLKQVGTSQQLAVLVTPGVTNAMRDKLRSVFDLVQEVNILDSKDEANLRLLKRPELGVTFTKLHCWRLTQFDKCVFLDADTLVLQNCDELFEREELSAAPDVGWPDCFNSGVFVYRPSNETYEKLVQFALEKGSFDGGDQGLLNLYFSDWAHKDISKHLPFIYNMCSTACYSYLPAFKQFGGNAKIIHFIGPAKPWLQYFDSETRTVSPSGGLQHLQHVLQRWWDIFCEKIHPTLSREMAPRQRKQSSSIIPNSPSPKNPEIHDFSSPDDYQNVWDPWDEYDNRQAGNVSVDFHNQQLVMEHISQSILESNSKSKINTEQSVNIKESEETNFPKQYHQEHNAHQPEIIPSYQNPEPSAPYHLETVSESHNQSRQESFSESHNTSADHSFHVDNSNVKVDVQIESIDIHPSPPVIEKTDPVSPDITIPPSPLPSNEFDTTTPVGNETNLHTELTEEKTDAGLAGAFAQLTLGVPRTAEQMALEDHLRRQGWEVGNIDYLGRDSFDNIWSKICETLGSAPEPKRDEPKEASELPKSKADETTKSKEPTSPTSSEVQSPQTPSEEVVTEKSEPASETKLIEQTAVLPTTQVVPATPTTPTEPEICPIKAPEVDTVPAPLPASVETPPPPQPEVCPLIPKSEVITTPSEEPPLPKVPETEAPVCPLAPKPSEEQPVPKSPETETPACPLAPKPSEPTDQACPLTPKLEEPSKTEPPKAADSAPLPETLPSPKIPESPVLPKSEASEEPKLPPAECSLPETATAPGEPSETLTECPLTPDPSGQKELILQSPVETPVVPETPKTPTEAPKAAAPEPKPEPPKTAAPEPPKAAAPEPKPESPKAAEPKPEPPKAAEPKPEPPKAAEPKAEPPKAAPKEEASSTTETTPTPTPPPRKGSGPKKVTKPKK
ncbi:proteoglycan 4 isoform X1 [Aethina tumida]|uniref:proteoglycan 4 isoform X1 n=1 Tax=Aethina tumida TaxID=116153 RepID=UPI00214835EF|nr:proteoglycan 4 isoform X1 [Aethina tumida]